MASDDFLRKSRGLGMLLANLGGNKDQGASNNGMTSQGQRDGGAANNSMMTAEGNQSGQGKSGNIPAGVQKERPEGGNLTKEFEDEDVYGPRSLNTWADIKEYDDDHDNQWFQEENARLAKKYGGNFIFARYLDSQPGRVGYYCQLCSAEMNAKKSLELHCSGMKHLKRKDQWEKGEKYQESGEHSGGWHERDSRQQPHRPPMKEPYRPPPRSWSDREQPRKDPYGGQRSHMEPRPYMRPPSPDYKRDDRGRFDGRDDYDKYSDSYYDDYYRNNPGPMPYRSSYDRDRLHATRENERAGRGPVSGGQLATRQLPTSNTTLPIDPYDGRRSPRDMKHDYDRHPGPPRRDSVDRYPRDRYNPYARREAPPPPVISGPPAFERAPAPPMNPSVTLFEGIADGSCGELLKKLSVCRVKSRDDTALASNVANYLVVSLRDYYHKTGPPTIVHVLDEIILKINILKDLQK